MKKGAAFALVAALFVVFLALLHRAGSQDSSPAGTEALRAGMAPDDFSLGYGPKGAYFLRKLAGEHVIILAFTDSSPASLVLDGGFEENFKAFLSSIDGPLWINVRKEGGFAVIQEKSGHYGIRYRTSFSKLPSSYSLFRLPTVVVIDRTNTIRTLYSGYSPTIVTDIKEAIRESL